MADRRLLTDRLLKSLGPAPKGTRIELFDSRLSGFGLRISDVEDTARRGKAGRISFILFARFQRGAAPTRRAIGTYGPMMTLEEARRIAGEWRSQIAKGIDPAVVQAQAHEKTAREAALRRKHSFAAVAETFILDKVRRERSGKFIERDFRQFFIAAWRERPVSEITTLDVLEIINGKKRAGAPQMARTLLIMIRRFFNWAIDQQVYGLTISPCDRLTSFKIIGPLPSRGRRLSDVELFALWRAAGRLGYPVGAVYRVLLLTGLRLNEAAQLAWREVHGDCFVIPAERMKGREGWAREHLVPFSIALRDIVASLPRLGPYMFTFNGRTPLAMSSPIKRELDRRMLATLKALARQRGENVEAVTLPRWTNHDLRRVVRSGLSQLRVAHNVAEAVLAHRPPGIVGVYDTHQYFDEKREALEAWALRLASIVEPQHANVIQLRARQ
jgi:integrase